MGRQHRLEALIVPTSDPHATPVGWRTLLARMLGHAIDAIFWERGRYAKMQM